jgi:30S ribosomal protein S31
MFGLSSIRIKEFPMGKGDRKTRRGKINRASYGNSRAHTAVLPAVAGKPAVVKPAAVKKAAPAPRKKSA